MSIDVNTINFIFCDRLILSLPTRDCDRSPKLGELDLVMRALFNRVFLPYDKVMFGFSGYLIDLKKSHLSMLGIERNQAIAIDNTIEKFKVLIRV
ncbi:MAG: hypothetical protein ACR2LR_02840 [Hassallia sp.]